MCYQTNYMSFNPVKMSLKNQKKFNDLLDFKTQFDFEADTMKDTLSKKKNVFC